MSQPPDHTHGDAKQRNSTPSSAQPWQRPAIGAALTLAVSLIIWLSPLGQTLLNLSADILFLLRPAVQTEEAVIIYMDEKSFRELNQEPSHWDRALHAQLLDRLTKDRAKLVVFDIWLADPGAPKANAELVRAIKENGKVVLAGIFDTQLSPGLNQGTIRPPNKEFAQAAAAWGLAGVQEDHATTVRKHIPNSELNKSLPWTAAKLAGAEITKDHSAPFADRWINYYGPSGTIPSISYCDATNQAPGYFQDKIVFIGSQPKALYAFEEAEKFRTPYTRWGENFSPGVEIMATTFLNLYRHDWLSRATPPLEFLILLSLGLALGTTLTLLRPWLAATAATAATLALFLISAYLFASRYIWFDWLLLTTVQIPTALAWSFLGKARPPKPAPARSPASPNIEIPDHTVLRPIGSGSYGEVLLARDALGSYHAVKLIRRDKFPSPQPFEREFQGLKKFTPFSREHESFVHILHVGINHDAGYFYYIMELADDVNSPQIHPPTYSPKTLASLLAKAPKLPLPQCLQIALALTSALDCLHRQNLIHRDIKPANIIFIKDKPKLADIGLVSEILPKQNRRSYLGTLGYIPPEGLGSPSADIYSLGKVLYEAFSGHRPEKYPCPPTTLLEGDPTPALLQLNDIILKACEAGSQRRYQSAAEMRADLLQLQKDLPTAPPA